jgi:uncharacterized cupin superfamily protein
MQIKITQPRPQDLEKDKVFSWPIWEKKVSSFDWQYDAAEECYFLEGRVTVQTPDGQKVEFGKGDFVTFPQGLSCIWEVKSPVRKHYRFR